MTVPADAPLGCAWPVFLTEMLNDGWDTDDDVTDVSAETFSHALWRPTRQSSSAQAAQVAIIAAPQAASTSMPSA